MDRCEKKENNLEKIIIQGVVTLRTTKQLINQQESKNYFLREELDPANKSPAKREKSLPAVPLPLSISSNRSASGSSPFCLPSSSNRRGRLMVSPEDAEDGESEWVLSWDRRLLCPLLSSFLVSSRFQCSGESFFGPRSNCTDLAGCWEVLWRVLRLFI